MQINIMQIENGVKNFINKNKESYLSRGQK